MKLQIGEEVYHVHFQYSRYDGRRMTRCEIHIGECIDSIYRPSEICGTRPHGVGFAFCNHLDEFVKAKGRKLALARAMREYHKESFKVGGVGMHRGIRTLVWAAYLTVVKERVRV